MDVDDHSPTPQPPQPQANNEYNVAIVCALAAESDAVEGLLDGFWPADGSERAPSDSNSYRTGWIAGHNVVIVYMPSMGKVSAAQVATNLRYSFSGIELCVLEGFCGGVPSNVAVDDILLGDVILSTAVLEYDFKKVYLGYSEIKSNTHRPNHAISGFLHKIGGKLGKKQLMLSASRFIKELLAKPDFADCQYPGIHRDRLYQSDYLHKHRILEACSQCAASQVTDNQPLVCEKARGSSCAELGCEDSNVVTRYIDESARVNKPVVHFGSIGSASAVMKSGQERDQIARDTGVIAFEMEGAGLWNVSPTIIIKGVCDYSDSHKSKYWQPYAAATAAACMKAVLGQWPKSKRPVCLSGFDPGIRSQKLDCTISGSTRVNGPTSSRSSSWIPPSQIGTSSFIAPRPSTLDRISERFEKDLEEAEIIQFQLVTRQKLYESIETIQQKHASEQNLQGMVLIGEFIKAVEQYSIACQSSEPYIEPNLRFIWGPLKFLLEKTYQHPDALSLLLDMYHNLGITILRSLEHLNNQPPIDIDSSFSTLVVIYHYILTFGIQTIKFFRKPVWEVLFPVCIDTLKSTLTTIIEQIEKRHSMEKGDFILKELKKKTNEATTRQLEAVPLLQSWINPEEYTNPQLWLTGIPGSGKTILVSLVIEEACKIKGAVVAFFFCRHRDPQRNTFLAVMTGILSQLLIHDRDLIPYFYDYFSRTGETTLTTISTVKELMQIALRNSKATYLIIDGLDECKREERKEIAEWFQNPLDATTQLERPKVRCLFVSQDDGYARKDFKNMPPIKITPKDNRQDMEEYCRTWAADIQNKLGISNQQRDMITSSTMRFAGGMFLYVALVMSNLFGQISASTLNQELQADKFPKGLEEAYERIIYRIKANGPDNVRYHAFRLLGWLVCSSRPLKWYEVQGAASVDFDAEDVNWQDNRFQVDAKDLCFSLVEISADQTVELVHKTADIFLQKTHINRYEEELHISIRCLRYLALPGCSLSLPQNELNNKIERGYYSFLEYVVTYWAKHVEAVCVQLLQNNLDVSHELIALIDKFLDMHWVESPLYDAMQLPEGIRKKMERLSSYPCAHKLGIAISITNKQLTSYGRTVPQPVMIDTFRVLARVRAEFERLVERITVEGPIPGMVESLQQYYGLMPYKCPRPSCIYYHNGFLVELERCRHIDQHDRPYLCTFAQEGCEKATDGFASEKLLKKHLAEAHANNENEDHDEFPLDAADVLAAHRIGCDDSSCNMTFTQRHNMLAHYRRTHTHRKPYSCTFGNCHAKFTTRNELRRHEGTHKTGAHQYSCQGCGRTFQRKDALGRHHKSDKGKACISTAGEQAASNDNSSAENIDLPPIDGSRTKGAFLQLPLPGPS